MTGVSSAEIIAQIGGIVAQIASPNPDGAFLYAEAEDGMVGTSLYKDQGAFVQWLPSCHYLAPKILDLWYAADEDKKWAALFLTIEGDQFDARFQYPEEWGDEDEFERREMVVAAKYGNKEVRYPPLEDMG